MEKIFTFDGLKKEFQRIRWPHWSKKETNTEQTVLQTTLKVLAFVAFFGVFFTLCDFLAVGLLKVLGV